MNRMIGEDDDYEQQQNLSDDDNAQLEDDEAAGLGEQAAEDPLVRNEEEFCPLMFRTVYLTCFLAAVGAR